MSPAFPKGRRIQLARRDLLLRAAALCATASLGGCRSMGLTPWKITHESTDASGKRVKKEYEVNDWDDFTATLAALADDFSAHAARVMAVTGELLAKMVELPPPGQVALSDIDSSLKPFEKKKRLDFIAAAAERGGEQYDFRYVRIGEPAFDDFFENAATTYGVAYQQSECERRRKLLSEKMLNAKVSDGLDQAVKEALAQDAGSPGHAYLKKLDALAGPLNSAALDSASAAVQLASSGARLVMAAPRLIQNPKHLLHLDKIVEGVTESVGLVADSAKLLAQNNALV